MQTPPLIPAPVDEAPIRAEIRARDALRREAGLPRLDVEAEVAKAVATARLAAYHEFVNAHAGERAAIRDAVITEHRDRGGATFPNGWAGHMALGHEVARRFTRHLRERYGVSPPG